MLFSMLDRTGDSGGTHLDYAHLEPFIEPGTKGLTGTLDRDGNSRLSDVELRLFMKRLQENGLPGAALEVRILVLDPTHNFTSKGEQARDCTLCHARDAKFYSKLMLEIPEKDGGVRTFPVEKGILVRRGQRPFMEDIYLLGESKIRREDLHELVAVAKRIGFKWIDLIGVFMLVFSLGGVCAHAMLMVLTRDLRTRRGALENLERLPVPIRAWHWLHGLCVILLLLTGIHLRLPDVLPIFATFLNAVNLHNLSAAVLIFDYVFWISYHFWKRDFKSRFWVSPMVFVKDSASMLHYYGYLIFVGGGYPTSCERYSDFDPVERLFFLTTMLVVVPVQVITGIMLFDVQRMTPMIRVLGGLRVVDAAHLLFGYLLVSSMIVHVYFHTLKRYRRAQRRESGEQFDLSKKRS